MMYFVVKRVMDVVVSIFGIFLFTPLFLIVAISIKLDSSGPIFFVQKRVGYKGKAFNILKFRTMVKDTDQAQFLVRQIRKWEAKDNDPRVTKIGGWLRKTGVDELPQLFNVIKGDMSLVGPRPYYQPRIDTDPSLKERLSIKPGCVSLAIVHGRVRLSEEEIKKYDKEYQKKQNLWLDVTILLKTIYLILSGKGF